MKDELTLLREELEAKENEYYGLEIKITYNYMVHYCKTFKDEKGNFVESRVYLGTNRISSVDIDDWIAEYCASTPEVQYSECYYIKLSPQVEVLFKLYRNLYALQSLCDSKNADPCIQEYLQSSVISPLLKELGSSAIEAFPKAKEELKKFLENNYNIVLDEKAIVDLN